MNRRDGTSGVTAKFALTDVRRLVPGASIGRDNARAPVCAEFGCSDPEAIKYVRRTIMRLTESDFRTRFLFPPGGPLAGQQADVYEARDNELVWYVKLRIVGSVQLIVHSFHPPLHSFRGHL